MRTDGGEVVSVRPFRGSQDGGVPLIWLLEAQRVPLPIHAGRRVVSVRERLLGF